MIKAIIFDCFGVLVGDALPGFIETHYGKNPEFTARAWDSDDKVNLGNTSEAEHFALLAELAGISVEEVVHELDKNVANQPLLNYIRQELKPRYKLGILSNIYADVMDELIGRDNRALFDAEALSFALGMVKPSLEIYRAAATMLNVRPEECIFIDDKQRYCDAAGVVGMKTICYASLPQFERDLQELLQ